MTVLLPLALPACADPDAGRALFEARCIRCHGGGAATLKTTPAQLPAVLTSGTLRAHRFTLSDRDIAALQAYLTQVKSTQR